MRTVKTRGMEDLDALRRRVKRAFAMERIGRPDFEELMRLMDALEKRIVEMRELNESGEEEG